MECRRSPARRVLLPIAIRYVQRNKANDADEVILRCKIDRRSNPLYLLCKGFIFILNDNQRNNKSIGTTTPLHIYLPDMNKTARIFLFALVIVLLAFTRTGWTQTTREQESENPMEERDDANAQAQYELLRQHDPATGKIPPNIRAHELA